MKKLSFLIVMLLFCTNVYANKIITNLIEPVKYFVNNNSQIKELANKLSIHQKISLLGISGIGKTQLARKYSSQLRNQYNIIWFFNCNIDLNEQFSELAKQINQNQLNDLTLIKLSEELKDAKREVMEFLAARNDWLLIFDNLAIGQNNKLSDILSWENNGHIIFCSQDSTNLPEVMQLSYLSETESMNLIENIMNDSNPILARELINEYKGYPIMVAQGASFLQNNKYMNLEEYKQILNKSADKTIAHIAHILKQLTPSAYDLLYKAALMNNQSFSKNLLSDISKFPKHFAEDLYSITSRFCLINIVDEKQNNPVFEMHDAIKQAILKIGTKKSSQQHLTEIITKINKIVKPGLPIIDSRLSGNLQKILENAENYSLSTTYIMEIRKSVFAYYMNNLLDYDNCQKMVDWLADQENSKSLKLWLMSPEEKAIYADYLIIAGSFYDIGKADYNTGITYFNKAVKILESVKGFVELKFEAYTVLAQTLIFSGDLINGKKNLLEVDKLIANNPNAKFENLGLLYFIKSKIALMEGKYEDALANINESLKAYSYLPDDSLYLDAVHIQEAEIFNYLDYYQTAEAISNKIYHQLKNTIKKDHEMHARALKQLARAEIGLGKYELALKHINIAKKIYINDKNRKNSDLNISNDADLADVFSIEAEVAVNLNKNQQAFEAYNIAETIYYNVYRENMKNIDTISSLYYQAAKASKKLGQTVIYERYKKLQTEMFGPTHLRTMKMNALN